LGVFFVHAGDHVYVDLLGEADRGMAESLTHDLDGYTSLAGKRGEGLRGVPPTLGGGLSASAAPRADASPDGLVPGELGEVARGMAWGNFPASPGWSPGCFPRTVPPRVRDYPPHDAPRGAQRGMRLPECPHPLTAPVSGLW